MQTLNLSLPPLLLLFGLIVIVGLNEREREGEGESVCVRVCVCMSARAKKELCFLWAGPQHHLSVMIIKRHLKECSFESLAELSSRDS